LLKPELSKTGKNQKNYQMTIFMKQSLTRQIGKMISTAMIVMTT
jgi:hypothetical protein